MKYASIVNPITIKIVRNVEDGYTIHKLAKKVGFAYSAVYKWVKKLQEYDVFQLNEMGNKTIIKVNKNLIYRRFMQLDSAVSVIDKDGMFWHLIKRTNLKVRFVKGTAVAIWTRGSYITGDFFDKIYFLEVYKKDFFSLKQILKKHGINYCTSEKKIIRNRPLVYIIPKRRFIIEQKLGLPVMPLNELVGWCKKLDLDVILEQLDILYDLNLKIKYAEVRTL